MTIGENIKRLRKEKGLTQKELSKLSGVHEIQLARYENNKTVPNNGTIDKLAKALDVDFLDLVYDLISSDQREKFEQLKAKQELLNTINNNLELQEEIKDIQNKNFNKVISLMTQLNNDGQNKAIEQVELLTLIERYTKK